jgi:hypothetical protein
MSEGTEVSTESVIRWCRKLLAKAESLSRDESTDNFAEVDAINQKVHELLTKSGIDAAMLAEKSETKQEAISVKRDLSGPYGKDQITLWTNIARYNRCSVIWTSRKSLDWDEIQQCNKQVKIFSVTIIGFAQDIEICELLFTSLYLQVSARLVHVRGDEWQTTKSARCSYFAGFTVGVRSQFKATQAAVETAAEIAEPGTALVLLSREEQVLAKQKQLFPKVRTTPQRRVHSDHYSAGVAAGKRANLGRATVGNAPQGALH